MPLEQGMTVQGSVTEGAVRDSMQDVLDKHGGQRVLGDRKERIDNGYHERKNAYWRYLFS